MKRLQELLHGTGPSYLTPLFWLHGEDEETLRHMIGQMHENGIGEFVVESRPHPDFLGDPWWHDVDIILDEAKKRDMKVWFFDDRKFPSGYSAGKIRDEHPEYLKIYLDERHLDAVGPQQGTSVFVDAWVEEGEELVGVIAARRTDGCDTLDYDSLTEITHCVSDGILFWDIPEGNWRIFMMVATREGGEEHTRDYLNPLEPEAVRLFLHYVYEAHYDRYQDDFGKTIAGFFSDEARFGNAESYDLILGCTSGCAGNSRPKVVLPWSKSLLGQLSSRWQGDFKRVLPCLWYEAGPGTAAVRYTFMDLVSALFADNYTQQIGDWCRAHKVKYMGHLIEENGAHARLGYGAGHFFRSIRGQDYPGLDLIHQVWPGVTEGRFSSQVGYLDADFFYWGITKMAASAAHIASKDSGTTICEIFGAYGWQAGLKLMKWLTDHICVRGVNLLVPHAFSPKACDWDAPPHFYDRGLNPQWRYFHIWSAYSNRLCHLLSGGTHIATAAVLYHAEAEWAGEYMPFEKPVKALVKKQIDCDIVPVDTFVEEGKVQLGDGCFQIGGETYRAMIVPYAERLPEAMLESLNRMAKANIPVLFVKDYPVGSPVQAENCEALLTALRENPVVRVCDCDNLSEEILQRDLQDVTVDSEEAFLRVYHYSQSDAQVYFMTNEAISEAVHTTLTLKAKGVPVFYDAMDNTVSYPAYTQTGESLTLHLDLDAYQSRFVIVFANEEAVKAFRENMPGTQEKRMLGAYTEEPLLLTLQADGWKVSASKAPQVDVFHPQTNITGLGNLIVPGGLTSFTGTIRYETEFELPELPAEKDLVLDLGRVYETAELWLNGKPVGSRIAPPYCFRVNSLLKQGINTIRVDVTNTLVRERGRNLLDRDMVQEPSGLMGPIRLFYTE